MSHIMNDPLNNADSDMRQNESYNAGQDNSQNDTQYYQQDIETAKGAITGAEFPTPAQYHTLLMRSALIIQVIEDIATISAEIKVLELDAASMSSARPEAEMLRANIAHKKKIRKVARNSLMLHKDNLKKTLAQLIN